MPTIYIPQRKSRDRSYNKSAYQDVYNTSRWKKLRRVKIKNNPLCEECLRQGKVTQAEEVHHIVPFDIEDFNEDVAYDYDNLISLCIEHHKEAHRLLRN